MIFSSLKLIPSEHNGSLFKLVTNVNDNDIEDPEVKDQENQIVLMRGTIHDIQSFINRLNTYIKYNLKDIDMYFDESARSVQIVMESIQAQIDRYSSIVSCSSYNGNYIKGIGKVKT